MLSGFVRADEHHRDVPTVAPCKFWILIDIHFSKFGAKFAKQWLEQGFRVLAEVAPWAGVESDLERVSGDQARILGRDAHGLGLEYFWKGPLKG